MIRYTIKYTRPWQHLLQISVSFPTPDEISILQLPYWRPGRYEAGHFAKNIQRIDITDSEGKPLDFTKIAANAWQVHTQNCSSMRVHYTYYAAEFNAGSTYLDSEKLSVNPVNCLIYVRGLEDENCHLVLDLPADWQVATSLRRVDDYFEAADLQELMDSPLIASARIQKWNYCVGETRFIVWLQGEHPLQEEKLIADFTAFTAKQIETFGTLPVAEYHFLIGITPYKSYHGVEHEKSTMIVIGPAEDLAERPLYLELLGVSSHELYHTWNVKYIRPADWSPYDFTRPAYSRLGYVAEGVTTYFGDVMLWRSQCFSDEEFLTQLAGQFQKHYDNGGRLNLSVADSSFDTWIDGYTRGIPNRKVSIYTEGCLIAFICDVWIMKSTDNQKSLNDVMRNMYAKYGYATGGYTEEDYWNELKAVAPAPDWVHLYATLVARPGDFSPFLQEALNYLGLKLEKEAGGSFVENHWGIKVLEQNGQVQVINVWPGSVAEEAGLWFGDTITHINGQKVGAELDKIAAESPTALLHLQTPFQQRKIQLRARQDQTYFGRYSLRLNENANFSKWKEMQ